MSRRQAELSKARRQLKAWLARLEKLTPPPDAFYDEDVQYELAEARQQVALWRFEVGRLERHTGVR
jgi:hypothetical protein